MRVVLAKMVEHVSTFMVAIDATAHKVILGSFVSKVRDVIFEGT